MGYKGTGVFSEIKEWNIQAKGLFTIPTDNVDPGYNVAVWHFI